MAGNDTGLFMGIFKLIGEFFGKLFSNSSRREPDYSAYLNKPVQEAAPSSAAPCDYKNESDRTAYLNTLMQEMTNCESEMSSLTAQITGYINVDEYVPYKQKYSVMDECVNAELWKSRGFVDIERKQLYEALRRFRVSKNRFTEFIDNNNANVFKLRIDEIRLLIGKVEGRELDDQQMSCIAKDIHSHLVLAGAGTGKTTTIVGKVKYLLMTGRYSPQDILMISFTNAAVNEMRSRLMKETNANIYVATFHKLGYDIIKRSEQKAPDVFSKNLGEYVREKLTDFSSDAAYMELIKNYLAYHRVIARSELLFSTEREYEEYLECNPPVTILEEPVKSYGEMEIANFLTLHGIKYEYETEYKFDTQTAEHRQYHPDFYLPEHDVYIEYFGIDRNNKPPAYFKAGYTEGIRWKRELHKANGTKMVECYAYEEMEGILPDKLRERLKTLGIPLVEVSFEEIIEKLGETKNSVLSPVAEVIAKIIALAKNRRLSAQELSEMCSARMPAQATLVGLITPIMESYERYLHEHSQIDFTDMVNRAVDFTRSNAFEHKFKCVIIDEYQDITASQYMLMKALRDQHDYELFCVGDDWQSIYRFAGSDIGYILNFKHYWEKAEISRIETTYRFSQRLIDISGDFIMENPSQYRKSIRSGNDTEKYVIGRVNGYTCNYAMQFMINKLVELPRESSVFLIGRYGFDADKLKDIPSVSLKYDNKTSVLRVYVSERPDLDIAFYTAHRSKGLQADHVFIINNRKTHMGFPSKVQNPPLVNMLLENAEEFQDAEERRLYYVALTRARKRVYLVTEENNISSFAAELIRKYGAEMKKADWLCPLCGGTLRRIKGQYGEFYGCSNYRVTGCSYKRKIYSEKPAADI